MGEIIINLDAVKMRTHKYNSFLEFDEELAKNDPTEIRLGTLKECLRLCDDPISSILRKLTLETDKVGNSNIEKGLELDDADVKLLDGVTPKSLLLKWIMNICLSTSKTRRLHNEAQHNCIGYLEALVTASEKQGSILPQVFCCYASLTLYKFPNFKECLACQICEKLGKAKIKQFEKFRFLNDLTFDERLISLFEEKSLLDLFINLAACSIEEEKNIDQVFLFCSTALTRFRKSSKGEVKKFLVKLAVEKSEYISDDNAHEYFPQILDFMKGVKDRSDSSWKIVHSRLDSANESLSKQLNKRTAPLPSYIMSLFKEEQDKFARSIESLSNQEKLLCFLRYTIPFNVIEINTYFADLNKGLFADLFAYEHLDDSCNLINYKEQAQNEEFSPEFKKRAYLKILEWHQCWFIPFINVFSIDRDLLTWIFDCLEENDFVHDEDIKQLGENILGSLKCSTLEAYSILFGFEEILRKFLKRNGIVINKNSGDREKVSLSYIFNNDWTNACRNLLSERIGSDYYLTLRWLLVDKAGFNIRNRLAHGIVPFKNFESDYFWFAIFLIIKLYLFPKNQGTS